MDNMLSFDAMPQTLVSILQKLDVLDQKIEGLHICDSKNGEIWFNLRELCKYLPNHPAKQTVYGWTSAHSIPFHKKGKSIIFLKSEIDVWLQQGGLKSQQTLEDEAMQFVLSKKIARF